jgi:hypothetical protein
MRVEQELALDAINARGMLQQLYQMPQEVAFYIGGGAGERKHISDDRLMIFVHAKGIAQNASIFYSDIAGQYARIKILQQEIGGGTIVPLQALTPETALLFQHRPQAAG